MKRKLTLNIGCCSWFNTRVPWAGCAGCCEGRIIVDISGAAAERAAERGSEEAASSSLERLSVLDIAIAPVNSPLCWLSNRGLQTHLVVVGAVAVVRRAQEDQLWKVK